MSVTTCGDVDMVAVADLIDQAADRLVRVGWCQKSLGLSEGPNCADGAVYWELGLNLARQHIIAYDNALRCIEDHVGCSVTRWNDSFLPDSGPEVIATLRTVAKNVRGG